MRVTLVFVCAFVLCSAETDNDFVAKFIEKVKRVSEECIAETKAAREDLKSLLEYRIPDSHEGHCLIFCFHRHFHIQNDDGTLNKAGAIEALEPLKGQNHDVYNKVVHIFNKCADSAPSDGDPCTYAKNLAECSIREGKSMNLDEIIIIE